MIILERSSHGRAARRGDRAIIAERPGVRETLFNVSALILSTALSGLILRNAGPGSPALAGMRAGILPIFGAAAVYFLTNSALAAAAVSLVDQRSLWETWRHGLFW